MANRNVFVLSFVDRRYPKVAKRITRQGGRLPGVSNVTVLDERSLKEEFRRHFIDRLGVWSKGFGYYCWKPHIIGRRLSELDDGDILLYVDGGTHLNWLGLKSFRRYVAVCDQSESGILAFQSRWIESHWSKRDLLHHFGVESDPRITDTGQIQSGAVFIRNSPETREFVERWEKVYWTDFALADDSPSKRPNFSGFQKHRHDQSILSILGKMLPIEVMSAGEQDARVRWLGWWTSLDRPIQHRRDIPNHLANRYKTRLAPARRKISLIIVRAKRIFVGTKAIGVEQ